MPEPKLIVIGERFTDRYFIGTTTRISPEAPVPVVNIKEVIQLSGGAGNVVENLKALGARVSAMYQPGHYPVKNRLMVGDVQLARWDQDDTCEPFTPNSLSTLPTIPDLSGIILSDYAKGAFNATTINLIASRARTEVPIFIDTKQDPAKFAAFGSRAFFFPNRAEYEKYESHYLNCTHVVRTEGAEGMTYLQYGGNGGPGSKLHLPAKSVPVRSVNGAGDTVVAAFAYAYTSLPDDAQIDRVARAMTYAEMCARDVVGQSLTSTPKIPND